MAAGEELLLVPVRDIHMIVWLQPQGDRAARIFVGCSRIVAPLSGGSQSNAGMLLESASRVLHRFRSRVGRRAIFR